jgi:hypothetical protein
MLCILYFVGWSQVSKYYLIPYFVSSAQTPLDKSTHFVHIRSSSITGECCHIAAFNLIIDFTPNRQDWYNLLSLWDCSSWLISCLTVMFTFLHHSDPTIPHYRKGAWTFLRGAAATVDRPLLGRAGRFFFHNISHDHVAHRKWQSDYSR